MEIKQILNNYKEKYKDNKNWEIIETPYYFFHYNKNSIAEEEINLIVKTQEDAYKKITTFLKLSRNNKKINYYLYSSEDQKKDYMGDDGNGQAIFQDFSIHVIYSDKIKLLGEHEDTHLLTLDWGVANAFFQEGLAEYMNNCTWHDSKTKKEVSSIVFVKKAYNKKINKNISNFFEHNFWHESMGDKWWYYYSIAGLFTKFIFEKFGLKKYKKFYMSINRNNPKKEVVTIFENIFGDINLIEKEFETLNNLKK